ncbi:uncharacterized protein LOC116180082 [Photinus pyralis]|uniref:uncharacterized protein LOC116180082 n=1 Tax=Photinus pyralis TaxID=7054 RepID=UPI0012671A88|nr:uncharacterized protein LOC116180082 [Photinus pyralis]
MHDIVEIMAFKILLFAVFVSFASAGVLAPVPAIVKLTVAAHPPVVSVVSPAITKTVVSPGSYSSSYRSDIITPRVKYVETPGVSITVPQTAVVATHVHHAVPVVQAVAVTRVEKVVPVFPTVSVSKVVPVVPTLTKIVHAHPAPLIVAPTVTKTVAIKSAYVAPIPLTHGLVSHSIAHL